MDMNGTGSPLPKPKHDLEKKRVASAITCTRSPVNVQHRHLLASQDAVSFLSSPLPLFPPFPKTTWYLLLSQQHEIQQVSASHWLSFFLYADQSRPPLSRQCPMLDCFLSMPLNLHPLALLSTDRCVCALHSALKSHFDPELLSFIQLIPYRLSIWVTGTLYSADLQDLKYVIPSTAGGCVLCAFATSVSHPHFFFQSLM